MVTLFLLGLVPEDGYRFADWYRYVKGVDVGIDMPNWSINYEKYFEQHAYIVNKIHTKYFWSLFSEIEN